MADNMVNDLLYEDFQNEDHRDFSNNNIGQEDDFYEDGSNNLNESDNNVALDHEEAVTNEKNQDGTAKKFQLFIGNLTWWTTDQNIDDAVVGTGISDYQEVKFFENRANGQSKRFCVITLGSEGSMRIVMENLPKKELNGQTPIVTLPTKQAYNQFDSQQPMNGGSMCMNPKVPSQGGNMDPIVMHGPRPIRMFGPLSMNHPNAAQMNNMPPRYQYSWNGPMMNRPPFAIIHPFRSNLPMHPAIFNQQRPCPQQGMWPQQANKMPPFEGQNQPTQQSISEPEFEEIMRLNSTVSSSSIARAVSDAEAGEYTSAIETLATAIFLIKQSKVADDERCMILITSLQDTLQGIEAKSFNRHERSISSERKRRRETSNSRSYSRDYRERVRDENCQSCPRKSTESSNDSNTKTFKRSNDEDRYIESNKRMRNLQNYRIDSHIL